MIWNRVFQNFDVHQCTESLTPPSGTGAPNLHQDYLAANQREFITFKQREMFYNKGTDIKASSENIKIDISLNAGHVFDISINELMVSLDTNFQQARGIK